MAEQGSIIDKLDDALGFNSGEKSVGASVFKTALGKVQKKRDEANEGRAVELIEKAITCRDKFDDVRRQFKSQEKKFEKELGKLVKSIESMAKGQKPQEENQENNG